MFLLLRELRVGLILRRRGHADQVPAFERPVILRRDQVIVVARLVSSTPVSVSSASDERIGLTLKPMPVPMRPDRGRP
jgi:hypothetical protein